MSGGSELTNHHNRPIYSRGAPEKDHLGRRSHSPNLQVAPALNIESALSDHVLPQRKMPKLIVVMAFDKDEDGNLFTAFGPADQRTEERAVTLAKSLADKHAGVIAWSRDANPDLGEYGPPTTLFSAGEVPDME